MNPATGEQIAEVGFASMADVDRAVAAAKAAAHDWRATPLSRRAEILFRFRELIVQHKQELAAIISRENGKTMADALGEVARGLENVEFACGIPHLLKGGYTEQASRGVDVYQIRQPLGVVAGITPFNFPGMVPLWMLSNAIACGNTFVLKPSEKVPGASVFLAGLLKEAGLPDGVLNLVHGDKVAVDRMLEHPDIKAVSFVGSTPVARYIYETATRNGKRVQALGGAKNHMLVLPDADIDMAADAAVSAGYGAAGERCMAISVVLAVGKVAEPLIDAIRERIAKIKVGPGSDPASEMGPLITREHRDRVASHLDKAAAEGATVAVDGRNDPATGQKGFFLGPSLIDNAKPGMALLRPGDFWAGAERGPRRHLCRGASPHQREPVRQRHRHLHAEWRRGAPVPVRCGSGHGGRQRSHSRARCLLQLWRLEELALRRSAHVRAGGRAVLHARAKW